jgi:major membrane immunogen (membrane-anchored lipoprotein)
LPGVYPAALIRRRRRLICYGPEAIEPHKPAAGYVDRILKGEKPADLPVQAPTKYEMVINFKTAAYEYKVTQLEAQLAEAKQNVLVLKADVEAATQKAMRTKVELDYERYQKGLFDKLATEQAVREEDVVKWATRVSSAEATRDEASIGLRNACVAAPRADSSPRRASKTTR